MLLRPRVAGVLIFGLGSLILFLLGYIYLFTPLTAGRAQHTLLQEITADPIKTFDLAQGKVPSEGSPVAVLEIPALHLVDAVVEGSNAQDLRSGPGHMPTTALPGQPGNAVIAGRRATFGAPFGAIGSLKRGQLIKVVDGYGTYRYVVTEIVDAEGGRNDVVTETKGNQLTLVTAASGFFPHGRLAVIAKLMGKPLAETSAPRFHVTAAELGLAADPASALLAVFWCLLFFVLLSLAVWLLRHWDQAVVVYVLAVPILLLVALFACESIVGYPPGHGVMFAKAQESCASRPRGIVTALLVAGCLSALGFAECGGPTNADTSQSTTSTTNGIVGPEPKGLSAAHAPMRTSFGTGSIGAADPTTTLPNERGQTIQPEVNPGQNVIIKNGRVFPQTLESSGSVPVVWYNLSSSPQRIIFDNYKNNPVDSGTIPAGGTFTWTPGSGGPYLYTLEPSGYVAKVVVNPSGGGPGAWVGAPAEPDEFTRSSRTGHVMVMVEPRSLRRSAP